MSRQYHGWIQVQRANGMVPTYAIQWSEPEAGGGTVGHTKNLGPGVGAFAQAIEHFEDTLKLGEVSLEEYGEHGEFLRVFTNGTMTERSKEAVFGAIGNDDPEELTNASTHGVTDMGKSSAIPPVTVRIPMPQGAGTPAPSQTPGIFGDLNVPVDLPRAYTVDEVREKFIEHIRNLVNYWADPKISRELPGVHSRISGFAHSFLSMLDGATLVLPSFRLISNPHPDDKLYCISEGLNWFPEEDIGGALHELLYQDWPKKGTGA